MEWSDSQPAVATGGTSGGIQPSEQTKQLFQQNSVAAAANKSTGCSQQTSTAGAGRKRAREEEEGGTAVEKRGCEEGMSWWTCLMLGVSQESQRIVAKTQSKN